MVVELLNINGTMIPHNIIPIIGNRACLFRAISFVLYDTQDKTQEVRKMIVTYVTNHLEDNSITSHNSDGNDYRSFADYFTDMLNVIHMEVYVSWWQTENYFWYLLRSNSIENCINNLV